MSIVSNLLNAFEENRVFKKIHLIFLRHMKHVRQSTRKAYVVESMRI